MNRNSLIVSHPTANANVRAALDGFLSAGLLGEFHTSVACFENDWFYKLSKGPLKEFRRRAFDTSLKGKIHTHGYKEMMRMLAMKTGMNALIAHEVGAFSIDKVYHYVDEMVAARIRQAASGNFSAVYAYEDGALESFKAAEEKGLIKFYDQPIGYWRAARHLMEKERELRPEWASTMQGFSDSKEKLERKDEEIQRADLIFAASSFTRKSLEYYPGLLSDIKVIPYGFPAVAEKKIYDYNKQRPLKVLFVGGLSQRKGIANLFEACNHLGKAVDLTVVGGKGSVECAALDKELSKHKWISGLPHHEILRMMKEQDVLVFPSLFEGFGLVITEAMSQGTPVITTDRTAGPDVINNGENGLIIQAGSTSALEAALVSLIDDPMKIETYGTAARETAALRPWTEYGAELAQAVSQQSEAFGRNGQY